MWKEIVAFVVLLFVIAGVLEAVFFAIGVPRSEVGGLAILLVAFIAGWAVAEDFAAQIRKRRARGSSLTAITTFNRKKQSF